MSFKESGLLERLEASNKYVPPYELERPYPHDGFTQKALSQLEVAKDLLKAHLSPAISQRIDWNTLHLSNKSYVTEQLKQLHSDVVYSCQVDGKAAYIYCFIEHQSKADPLLPFRMLQYNVLLLEEHLAQGHKQLPIVINLCLYSGQQTPSLRCRPLRLL